MPVPPDPQAAQAVAADVTAITALKHRYLRLLDLKRWEEFAEVFTPDVTGRYAGLDLDGRDALVDYMRSNLGPGMITLHQVHHPEVEVGVGGDPDEARGTWYLEDRVLVPDFDFVLEGAAFYEDRYRRTDEGWRISHTGYRRTFEVSYQMSAIPGWKLKVGDAYDAPPGA